LAHRWAAGQIAPETADALSCRAGWPYRQRIAKMATGRVLEVGVGIALTRCLIDPHQLKIGRRCLFLMPIISWRLSLEDQAMLPQSVNTNEYEVDELGDVNNAIYLSWVQAAVVRLVPFRAEGGGYRAFVGRPETQYPLSVSSGFERQYRRQSCGTEMSWCARLLNTDQSVRLRSGGDRKLLVLPGFRRVQAGSARPRHHCPIPSGRNPPAVAGNSVRVVLTRLE